MIDQDSLMGMSGRTTEDLFEGNNVVQSSANIPTGPQQQPYTEESIDPQLLGLPISPLTEEQLPASQLIPPNLAYSYAANLHETRSSAPTSAWESLSTDPTSISSFHSFDPSYYPNHHFGEFYPHGDPNSFEMPEADPGQRLPQLPQQYEAQNEPQEIIGAESSIQSEFGSKRSGKRKRRDEDAAILSEEQRDAFHSWLRLRKGPPPLEKLVLYAQSAEIPIALLQKYLAKISNGMAIYNTGEPVVQGPIAPRNITTLVGSTQGRPATAAAASHVPSSSTSNGQHGVAQHTTLDEEMRSCWDSCVKKKIDSQKCREVPESEPYTGEYIWQCTWGCNRRFKRKDEWERHEHNRQPQDLWVCILCRESQERSQHPHITFRLDKMKEHLVKVHFKSKKEADDIYGPASCYEYPTTIEPLCGFGGYAFRNDHDRSHHLTEHFMGRYGHFNIKDYDRNWDPAIQGVCSTDESTQSEALLVPAEFRGTRSSQSGFSTGKSASRTRNSSASPSSFRPQTSSHMNNLPTSVPLASFTYFTHRIALLGTLVFGLNGLELGLHFEETLGQGAFARVEKVRHGPTGLHFAMKSHYRSNQPEAAFRHFKHELQIMQRLNHPNCVHLVAAFPHARMPSLIMAPVADFDLERYLLRPDQYPDVQIHEVIRGFIALASGLLYLHSQSVLHNDIKPANILVKTTDLIYADFGTSSTTSDVPHTSHSPTLTPIYAAPEVLHFSKRSAGSDVFSLGCVFLELATVVLSLPVSGLRARVASSIGKCGRKYCSCERRPVSRQYLRPKVSALRGTAAILADRLLGLCLNMLNPLTTLRPTSLDVLSDLSRLLHIMPPSISTPRGFWSLEAHNAGRKSAAKGLYSSNVGFRRPTMSPFSDLLLHWTVRFHPRRQPTPVRPALLGPKPHAKRETQVQPFAHENNNASGLLELGPPTSPSEPFSVRLVDRNVASTLGANDIAVFDDKTGLSYVTEGATRVKNLGKWQNLAILAPVLRAAATIAFDLPVRFLWIIRQSPEPLNVMSIFQHAAAIITASILVPYVDGYSESLIKAFRRMRLDRKKRLYLRQSDLEAGGLPDKEDAEGEDCDYLGTDRRRLSLAFCDGGLLDTSSNPAAPELQQSPTRDPNPYAPLSPLHDTRNISQSNCTQCVCVKTSPYTTCPYLSARSQVYDDVRPDAYTKLLNHGTWTIEEMDQSSWWAVDTSFESLMSLFGLTGHRRPMWDG